MMAPYFAKHSIFKYRYLVYASLSNRVFLMQVSQLIKTKSFYVFVNAFPVLCIFSCNTNRILNAFRFFLKTCSSNPQSAFSMPVLLARFTRFPTAFSFSIPHDGSKKVSSFYVRLLVLFNPIKYV